jgi:hypothetical protein
LQEQRGDDWWLSGCIVERKNGKRGGESVLASNRTIRFFFPDIRVNIVTNDRTGNCLRCGCFQAFFSEFLLGASQKPYNTNLLEHREEEDTPASGCCLGKLDLWLAIHSHWVSWDHRKS